MTFALDAIAGSKTLFSKDASGNGEGGHITAYISDGILKIRQQSADEDEWIVLEDHPITEGQDYHAAFSFGEDGLKVYLNGELVDLQGRT